MNKVFLYLYPIEEYTRVFFLGNEYYDLHDERRPFDVLNDTIRKRYRNKGYKVVFAIYPDKEIFGVVPAKEDTIIQTDITFEAAGGYYENGTKKPISEIRYPSEQFLINQLGTVDELVVGGYHYGDCVRRLAELALDNGINTIIDLDMTDLFFSLYKKTDYFNEEEYDPENFKKYIIYKTMELLSEEQALELFDKKYSSSAYGFNMKTLKRIK